MQQRCEPQGGCRGALENSASEPVCILYVLKAVCCEHEPKNMKITQTIKLQNEFFWCRDYFLYVLYSFR